MIAYSYFFRLALPPLLLAAALGCQFVPRGRFESAEAQNRTLNEQNRAQLAEIENLKIHSRNVEDQLIKAEEELAKLDDQSTRDKHKMANLKSERERLQAQFPSGGRNLGIPPAVSSRLASLAQRYPSLKFDAETGISKVDTDVLFASGDATLKPQAEKLLVEFAEVFQAPEARDMKIMVVGHTDGQGIKGREVRSVYPNNWHLSAGRALAVADRLRKAGFPEDRMGVAGFGQHQPTSPNDSIESRQKNRRVEIFVIGPETPVVGWTETMGESLYRR